MLLETQSYLRSNVDDTRKLVTNYYRTKANSLAVTYT